MLYCPVCCLSYENIKAVISHIKMKHFFDRQFPCKQENCLRVFQNIYTFKRHLLLKHKDDEVKALSTKRVCEVNDSIVTLKDGSSSILNNNSSLEVPSNIQKEDFKNILLDNSILFVSKLYSNYSLPRNIVQNIINDLSETLKKPVEILQNKINSMDSENEQLIEMLTMLKDIFKPCGSEYFRFKQFRTNDAFIEPLSVIIGQTLNDKRINSRMVGDITNCTYQYIPVKKTLQKFLELPFVYQNIISNINSLNKLEPKTSLIQGTLWKNVLKSHKNKIVLHILLYCDDFEIGNPLGSHAGIYKICGVYFSLGCLPPEYSSVLENIFLVQLCFSDDIKSFGIEKFFQYLLQDLKTLETDGLDIQTESGSHTVYFSLALILGDNLGVHTILGLTQSFTSNYFCRFCRIDKNAASVSINENSQLLRNTENYEIDLNTQTFGIKSPCIWNTLKNFHLTENLSVDVMHDILEGICRYDLGNILYHFICVDKIFSLDTLNNRIKFYNFFDKNKPPLITRNQLLRKHIIFSASEMNSFTKKNCVF